MLRLLTLAGLLASAGAFAVPAAPGISARAPRAGTAHTRRGIFGASMSSFLPVEPGFKDRTGNAYQPDMPSLQNPIILRDSQTKEVVEINTHGACVTSYRNEAYDVLFRRPDAVFDGSKPISGGVPLCWPQFGPGDIQQHGFARNLQWECVDACTQASGSMVQRSWTKAGSRAIFELTDTKASRAIWKHRFNARYGVELTSGCLSISLRVKNTDINEFSFTGALHTYFAVDDLAACRIAGLKGKSYLDKTDGQTKTDSDEAIAITGFTERVYADAARRVTLQDGNKAVSIKSNAAWKDLAVWNPYGDEKMAYSNFVCIENGVINEPITLQPGEEWEGKIEIIPYVDGAPAYASTQ